MVDHIHDRPAGKIKILENDLIRKFAQQSAMALAYLHIVFDAVHHDVAPNNMLVDETGNNIKLSGYGISTIQLENLTSAVNNLPFSAPEAFEGEYTKQSDWWSWAATFFLYIYGHVPFEMHELIDSDNNRTTLENRIENRCYVVPTPAMAQATSRTEKHLVRFKKDTSPELLKLLLEQPLWNKDATTLRLNESIRREEEATSSASTEKKFCDPEGAALVLNIFKRHVEGNPVTIDEIFANKWLFPKGEGSQYLRDLRDHAIKRATDESVLKQLTERYLQCAMMERQTRLAFLAPLPLGDQQMNAKRAADYQKIEKVPLLSKQEAKKFIKDEMEEIAKKARCAIVAAETAAAAAAPAAAAAAAAAPRR